MYGVQLAWAEVLNAPVLVNAKDAEWLQRRGDAIELWSGERRVTSTITLYELGGHFPGSCVALWSAGAAGRGVLLAGDTIFANPDGTASFMRSYPNRIPLSAAVVLRLADATDRLDVRPALQQLRRRSSTPTPGPWSASPPTGTRPGCGATSTT